MNISKKIMLIKLILNGKWPDPASHKKNNEHSGDGHQYHKAMKAAFRWSYRFGILAILLLLLYSAGQAWYSRSNFFVISGIAISISFASFAFGGVIGFLFGVPKYNGPKAKSDTAKDNANNNGHQYESSHHIEEIADWLTKIIVGVGLTQAYKIIPVFKDLCVSLGNSMSGSPAGQTVAGASIVLFSIDGFLIIFLWTYLYLSRAQNSMDETKRYFNRRHDENQNAIDKAYVQLHAVGNAHPATVAELSSLFEKATHDAITYIFYEAVDFSRQNVGKPDIKNVIPVFTAFLIFDHHNEHPENHAEIGFALMHEVVPDYNGAITSFDKAIDGFKGHLNTYNKTIKTTTHFCRAYCNIKLAEDNQSKGHYFHQIDKDSISQDLEEAKHDDYGRKMIHEHKKMIDDWKDSHFS